MPAVPDPDLAARPLVAVNASASAVGRCHRLADIAVELAGGGRVIDLALLDADALFGRRADPVLDDVMKAVTSTPRLVLVTPVRGGTYSALLKAFTEVLPGGALEGTRVVLGGTGPALYEFPAVDPSLRALVEGLGGEVTDESAYASDHDFTADGSVDGAVRRALQRALAE